MLNTSIKKTTNISLCSAHCFWWEPKRGKAVTGVSRNKKSAITTAIGERAKTQPAEMHF